MCATYLHLCRARNECIEVFKGGARLVDGSRVKFRSIIVISGLLQTWDARSIPFTLIIHFTVTFWKDVFLMLCKTRSRERSKDLFGIIRIITPQAPLDLPTSCNIKKTRFSWTTWVLINWGLDNIIYVRSSIIIPQGKVKNSTAWWRSWQQERYRREARGQTFINSPIKFI